MIFTFILSAAIILSNIGSSSEPGAYKSLGCDFFGPKNAARLLGSKFRGEDTGMKETADGKSWSCTFLRVGDTSERSPKIYFSLKMATTVETAVQAFNAVRASNSKNPGWSEWSAVGDEAIVHSDAPNFHLVTIRKGRRTITVKINPADGVALSDVKDVMAGLAERLDRGGQE